jgi:rhodanese-related sulfurtransferase
MTRPAAIAALLETARKGLDRVQPADLASEFAAGALVVDIRPIEQRHRDGDLPGALTIDRNILEWRLDPTSPDHIPEVTGTSRRIMIVCNEGYSSSLRRQRCNNSTLNGPATSLGFPGMERTLRFGHPTCNPGLGRRHSR